MSQLSAIDPGLLEETLRFVVINSSSSGVVPVQFLLLKTRFKKLKKIKKNPIYRKQARAKMEELNVLELPHWAENEIKRQMVPNARKVSALVLLLNRDHASILKRINIQ